MNACLKIILTTGSLLMTMGCASYTTPGAAANLNAINDRDIRERFSTKPAASFPARLAIVRVQDPGYYCHGLSVHGRGDGLYTVITTRDIEDDAHIEKLAGLPRVAGLASLNRLLLPPQMNSLEDLRAPAASLHADMLLLYTLDTSFNIKNTNLGPLGVVTLGMLPNKNAYITTTASAVLYDVRTGHVYGVAEASDKTTHMASGWNKGDIIDAARRETEKAAFAKLVDAFAETWSGVLNEYQTAAIN